MASQNTPFPPVPPIFKSLQMFMKIASELEKMDAVVGYWIRFYCVQTGIKIDSKSKEAKAFLIPLMDWLEKQKKALHDNEAITNEMVGQAHVENYALGIFNKADTDDREGRAGKNTSRLFLISSQLFEVLSVFGEIPEEIRQRMKYAKWKAIYINKCLKNGETPIPGPAATDSDSEFNFDFPNIPTNDTNTNVNNFEEQRPSVPSSGTSFPSSMPSTAPSQPMETYPSGDVDSSVQSALTAMNGLSLAPQDLVKAQKYCKFAASALQYEDVPTAVTNLQKALSLLMTSKEQ